MEIINDMMDNFMNWAEFDEIGDLVGIREDAPDAAKKAYKEFTGLMDEAKRNGVKI